MQDYKHLAVRAVEPVPQDSHVGLQVSDRREQPIMVSLVDLAISSGPVLGRFAINLRLLPDLADFHLEIADFLQDGSQHRQRIAR